tara:strand:+ start:1318 stop:3597 length:2280 start_codon:yes stop_codon:yes gene_type:complete
MALNNCTINSASVTVNQGQALGSTASQVLTITPDAGYVVAAADFTNNSGNLSGSPISSIAITDSTTTPYSDNNLVLVTCDLNNSYVANNSLNYIIDIDGDAKDKKGREFTVAGTLDATVSNATPSSFSGEAYTGSGVEGSIVTIANKTFTASAGNYFSTAPTATVSTGTAADYIIEHEDTVNNNFHNRLIKRRFIIKYKFPASFVTGNNIDFVANAVSIPASDGDSAGSEIKNLVIDESVIQKRGDARVLKIYGNPAANFELTVTRNSDSKTYDFTSELDDKFTTAATKLDNVNIGSDGLHEAYISIPAITGTSESYKIKVTAESGSSVSSNITNYNNANPNITLTQADDITITLTTANGTNITNRTTDSITGPYGETSNEGNNVDSKSISYTVVSSSNMYITRQPIFPDDFSNVDASGNQFFLGSPTITGSGGTTLTITGTLGVGTFGTANVTSALNLTNILSVAPTTQAFTSNGNEDTTQNINLASYVNNPQGNTLTYSIVADNTGSNGTLTLTNSSTGAVTYVPAANNNTNVNFTFKVNDGVQDSNTSIATVQVTPVNDAPTDIALSSQTIAENNSIGAVIGNLSTTDVDAGDTHTYTLVSGTGSTDNASFTITGSQLKAAVVFDYETKNSYSIRVRSTDSGSLYFEKQFTISISDVAEGGSNYVATLCSPFTGTVSVNGSSFCDAGSTALFSSGFMSTGASNQSYVRFTTVSGGCTSTHTGYMRLTGATTSDTATHLVHGECYYNDCSGNGENCI